MLYRVAATILVFVSLLSAGLTRATPVRAVSCGPCPATTTDQVNLRAGPSTAHEVLRVIPADAALEWDPFGTQANGFVPVSYDGTDGYAHRDYLLLFPTFGATTDWLNLRTEPTLASQVLEVLPPGAEVQVLAGPENGFYAVRYEQRAAGYAHGDYLDLVQPGAFAAGDDVVVATEALNLRGGAGLSEDLRAVLVEGVQLIVTQGPVEADGYHWYQVAAAQHGRGWVAGEYLARV